MGEGARVEWSGVAEGENHPGGVLPHIATIDTWRDRESKLRLFLFVHLLHPHVGPAPHLLLVDSPVFRYGREREGQTAMSVEYVCRTCRTSPEPLSCSFRHKSCRLEQRLFVRLLHDLSPARKEHRSCSRSSNYHSVRKYSWDLK